MTTPTVYAFGHFATTEAAEHWLAEVEVDFTELGDAVQFAASLEAVTRGDAGSFRIRMGGSSMAADGVEIVEFSTLASEEWAEDIAFAQRVVTRGVQLFKLTGEVSVQDTLAEINAGSFTLWAEPTEIPLVLRMIGVDIWMAKTETSSLEYTVTPSRDWQLVSGKEAYRQSLIRRFLTSPGEYRNKPDYGAGVRAAVKARGRQVDLDDISTRLRSQALKDERTARVLDVAVERIGNYGIKFTVKTQMTGDDGSDVTITDTISSEDD